VKGSKMNRVLASLASVSLAVMVFTTSGFSRCPVKTISLSTAFKQGHILADFSLKFKEIVEQKSRGLIQVNVDAGTKTEEEVNILCSQGVVDMQATGGYPLQVFAPQYFFFNGPYVIKDYEHFLRVWNGSLGWEAKELIYNNGNMLSIGTVYRGLRQMTSNKPIDGPDSLVGLRLRLPSVPVWTTVWQALETSPVTVPLTGLYQALADGTAEASEGDLAQISSFKLYEVQSHLSITNHLVAIGWITFNKDAFQRFNLLEQVLILYATKVASDWATAKTRADESVLMQQLIDNGMNVVTPDADAIREKAKPAVEALFQTEWPVTTWEEVLAE
jgi:TRAP-type C4-dicarboxylate transport system substrate-binding protein